MAWRRTIRWTWLAVIVASLFYPFRFENHGHWENIIWPPFSRINSAFDFAQNVALFLPFGYLWMPPGPDVNRMNIGRTVLAAAGLSLCGEFGQIFIHFRSPSSTDVVLNVFGALAGACLARRSAGRAQQSLAGPDARR